MQWQSRATNAVALAVSACVVVQSSLAPLLGAQAAAPTAATTKTTAAAPDPDGGWPRD